MTPVPGTGVVAWALVPVTVWVWIGVSATVRVCAGSPVTSPCGWFSLRCSGTRPRRSGRAKVTRPSPPYVVPRSEKRAWFWLIGKSWPLHAAHPLGANW